MQHHMRYIYELSDNSLILGQRLGELCGHGPSLETDIAMTNIALDLFGQTRSYYQYAAKLAGGEATEDTLAFLRNERQYCNVLLVEQPNTDFAWSIGRQYLFDVFHLLLLQGLSQSKDETLAAIAVKSIKEVSYHKRFSGDWVRRLGDGTDESKSRMQAAIDDLWTYTEELFMSTESEQEMVAQGIAVPYNSLRGSYYQEVSALLTEAGLQVPDLKYFQKGGRSGIHSEHMGYLLADLQYMQRTFPNMNW